MNDDERAQHAKRILEDPVFVEAYDLLRDEILTTWEHSGAHDQTERETAWLALKILSRFRVHFESLVTTGEMSKRKNEIGLM